MTGRYNSYRLGRVAARHPWTAVGAWVAVAAVVARRLGVVRTQELEDSSEVPGLDSQRAADAARAPPARERAGLTAQIVVTPRGDDPRAGAAERSPTSAGSAPRADLPHVLTTSRSPSRPTAGWPSCACSTRRSRSSPRPTWRRSRTSPPAREALGPRRSRRAATSSSPSRSRGGIGELAGIAAAALILLRGVRLADRHGAPDRDGACSGSPSASAAIPLVAHLIDVPIFAPELASMIGLGVGIDYALFILTRHREHLGDRSERRRRLPDTQWRPPAGP